MLLKEFIERTRMVELSSLPSDRLDELLQRLADGATLADLAEEDNGLVSSIPVNHLRRLSEARRTWIERERACDELFPALVAKGHPSPPLAASVKALVPHKVLALTRAVSRCKIEDFPNEEAFSEALGAYVDIWSGAVNLALKRGELRCVLDSTNPEASRFQEYARRRESLSGLQGHRWLAIRRGEKSSALKVEFNWPASNIRSLLESMRSRLGPVQSAQDLDKLVEEFILDHLPDTIRQILDRRVEDEAIRSAVALYAELLSSPPLCEAPVGVVSVGAESSGLGVAVVNEAGEVLQGNVVDDGPDWLDGVFAVLSGRGVECVVLPATAIDTERLLTLRRELGRQFAVVSVRSAALSEARNLVRETYPDLEPPLASAVVLAMRALDPGSEWAKVDPVSIGLAEYQHDLDQQRLSEAMLEALGLFKVERRKQGKAAAAQKPQMKPKPARPKAAPRAQTVRLNPLVSSISDLKAGMMVNGVVTNITRFGVFVNLGLEEEAMIHISELSSQFVSTPTDVVSLGQQLSARVLEVDAASKRVALSLKMGESRPAATTGIRTERRVERKERTERKSDKIKERSDALRQLEDLFKK